MAAHLAAGDKGLPLLARLVVPAGRVKYVCAAVGGVAAMDKHRGRERDPGQQRSVSVQRQP